MTADRLDPSPVPPAGRRRILPTTRAFLGGLALGLVVGAAIGFILASTVKLQPKWTDAGVAFVRLPEQAALGPAPQTFNLPASSYDFGGVGAPLPQTAIDNASIVKVQVQATGGRVGVSLARPDGGELVSREAVISPQQGKTTVYFRTAPGMGPVNVLLRSADNAGTSATLSTVQTARQADIGQSEMNDINRAGVY